MKAIKLGKKDVRLPENWQELTRDQYFMALLLLVRVFGNDMPAAEVEKTFFSFLIGWNGADWQKIADEETLQSLETVFAETRKCFSMERLPYTGGMNLMPKWEGHRGPSDMFGDMKWWMFVKAMALLTAYCENDDRDAVVELARVLYRLPEGKNPDSVLQLQCLILMQSIVWLLNNEPVNIDGKDIDFSIIFKGDKVKDDDGTGMTGVTFAVAESGVFGDYRKVNQTGMWEILTYLYKCKKNESKNKKS